MDKPETHFARDADVLSPGTRQKDRVLKMTVHARYGIPHLWLVDALVRMLEAQVSENRR